MLKNGRREIAAERTDNGRSRPFHVLGVSCDETCRLLIRAVFHLVDLQVGEVESVEAAGVHVAICRPDLLIVDDAVEGAISFCERLRADSASSAIPLLLLSGERRSSEAVDACLEKSCTPLELLGAAERLAPAVYDSPPAGAYLALDEQLLLSTYDLHRLAQAERRRSETVEQRCHAETVEALLQVLAWSDDKTGAHSRRVQRYASELTRELAPALLEDPSLLPGFLLHDVGKIAIPDQVLQKPGPLAPEERALMQTHAVLGAQLLSGVSALEGAGLAVIRSHHERWDGEGYPDGLAGEEIPLAARIFAVADALDALTSDRPYRPAGSWNAALEVIAAEAGKQFDPAVVAALERIEGQLRTLCDEMGRSNGSLSLPVLHAVGAAAVPVRA